MKRLLLIIIIIAYLATIIIITYLFTYRILALSNYLLLIRFRDNN